MEHRRWIAQAIDIDIDIDFDFDIDIDIDIDFDIDKCINTCFFSSKNVL